MCIPFLPYGGGRNVLSIEAEGRSFEEFMKMFET